MRIIAILIFLIWPTHVFATSDESLHDVVASIFGSLDSKSAEEGRVKKGVWNSNRTALSLVGKLKEETHVYVFLIRGVNEISPVKIRAIKNDEYFPKTGQLISYYDRYEVEPSLYGDINAGRLSISFTYRAWKDGQRYTVHLKPIGINKDGSLDYSQY